MQPKEKGYTVKKVTLNEVKQSSLIKSSLDKIEKQLDYNKLNTTTPTKNKNHTNTTTSAVANNGPINNKDNTFTILTDEILQVSTDSTDVYTFRIEIPTKPESSFENFVIHKNSDGSIAYYIYSYKNYNDDFTALNVSRKKVSEDQINIGDFNDYIPSYKDYDAASDCWIEAKIEGGALVITFSDCGTGGPGGGGDAGSGSGSGGGWSGGIGASDGSSAYAYTNNGNGTCNYYYMVAGQITGMHQEIERNSPCPSFTNSSSGSGSSSDGDSTDPWANSNYDTLHDGGNTGGGGTSPSNTSSTDGTNLNDGDVIAVLAPTPLEREINTFFNNISDEQKECMVFGWNKLKTDITNFFKDNQTVMRPSLGGTVYDGALIDSSLKDFAHAAIDAHCAGGDVDFDDNVVLSKEFKDNIKLKCVYDKLAGDNNSLFRDTVGAFIDNPNVNLIFTVGNCVNTNVACTQDQYVDETGIITVTIEDINANPIELAQMIIHEAIHAEIAKFVSEFQTGVETNNRPLLFTLYAYHKGWADNVEPGYNWDNGADHHFMITNYINRIATTLKQFDNDRYSLDYYKSYAWDGLRGYDYKGSLTDSEDSYFTGLRSFTNTGIEVCN